MFADAYHAFASHFASRLNPLQFRSRNSIEDRVSALERPRSAAPSPSAPSEVAGHSPAAQAHTPPHVQEFMPQRESVRKVGEDFHAANATAHAQDVGAASDLLHTFNQRMDAVQAQTKPSGGAWDDFHNAFNRPSVPSPQPTRQQRNRGASPGTSAPRIQDPRIAYAAAPRTPAAAQQHSAPQHSPGGVGRGVQRGLFPPAQSGPRVKAAPKRSEPKAVDPRTQTGEGLFPKSAVTGPTVKNKTQFKGK